MYVILVIVRYWFSLPFMGYNVLHFVPGVGMFEKLKTFSELVVLPHSVFALPFALVALLAATQGRPSLSLLFWVVVCMVLARTAAMAYNRLVDADLDARNPRTAGRPIPSGRMSKTTVKVLTIVCGFGFVLAAGQLNALCFRLSPLALGVLLGYSHMKRVSWLTHFVLGLALGIAPVGAWIAATGTLALPPLWLMAAVICFVAGFDILYATQDETIDRKEGLHSLVVSLGVSKSLWVSRILHALMVGLLAGFGVQMGWGQGYLFGMGLLGAGLVYMHRTQYGFNYAEGQERFFMKPAMMKVNGYVAVLYLIIAWAAIWQS